MAYENDAKVSSVGTVGHSGKNVAQNSLVRREVAQHLSLESGEAGGVHVEVQEDDKLAKRPAATSLGSLEVWGNRSVLSDALDAGNMAGDQHPSAALVDLGQSRQMAAQGSSSQREVHVWCGGHAATTCQACPQGKGDAWCNGDCSWTGESCFFRFDKIWCGGHSAEKCSDCTQYGARDMGYLWCNGECHWRDGACLYNPNAPWRPDRGPRMPFAIENQPWEAAKFKLLPPRPTGGGPRADIVDPLTSTPPPDGWSYGSPPANSPPDLSLFISGLDPETVMSDVRLQAELQKAIKGEVSRETGVQSEAIFVSIQETWPEQAAQSAAALAGRSPEPNVVRGRLRIDVLAEVPDNSEKEAIEQTLESLASSSGYDGLRRSFRDVLRDTPGISTAVNGLEVAITDITIGGKRITPGTVNDDPSGDSSGGDDSGSTVMAEPEDSARE